DAAPWFRCWLRSRGAPPDDRVLRRRCGAVASDPTSRAGDEPCGGCRTWVPGCGRRRADPRPGVRTRRGAHRARPPGDRPRRSDDDMGIGRWFTYWSADELQVAVPSAGLELVTVEDHEFALRTVARYVS